MAPARHGFALAALLVLAAVPGCRPKRPPPEPSEASLRPYDFRGHTRWKLRRLCEGADRVTGSAAARRHLRCGLVLLDWFLLAVLREDATLQAELWDFLRGESKHPPDPPQGDKMLSAIANRLRAATRASPEASTAQMAEAAVHLVELQRVESRRWSYDYLRGIAEAARAGSPVEFEARVIIAGAALDALKTASKASPERRAQLLVQGLGFSCPAEAERARSSSDSPERKPSCPLSCPEVEASLARVAPSERKALVAAKCPLGLLGLAHREHGVYLSGENLPVLRAVAFQLQNLRTLEAHPDHPLVESLTGALATLRRRLGDLRVPIGLPELSRGEPVHLQVPLCASAEDPVTAPVVLVLDETRLFAATPPMLAVQGNQVTFLDWREGVGFPGRPVEEATAEALGEQIRRLRKVTQRLRGAPSPQAAHRVALYAASDLSSGRLADLLDVLAELGVTHVELVLRNADGALGAVTAAIEARRRGEGPPLTLPPPPTLPPDRTPLELELGPQALRLRAAAGPLAAAPLAIPAGDLAGLREALEKTRRAYRDVDGVRVHPNASVPYRDVARLLHHLRRSSSGRILYATMIL